MTINWNGVFPALTTNFNADDSLDLKTFAAKVQMQMEAGVTGIIVGGSLGEASTLTTDEKLVLLETAIKTVRGRIPIVLNIAEQVTADAVLLARMAENAGAGGLMLLPPMRYNADYRETLIFFTEVAKSVSIPIMIYNNPVDYKIEVTKEMFSELLAYDNIQAVKESTRDITNITRLKNAFGGRLKVLCGVDTLAMESLVAGADGWVAGLVCAFPNETVTIYNLIKHNKYEEALAIYRWFMPLLELDIHPKLVQYIKLAESCLGIGSELVRAPRLILVGKEREVILEIINEGISKRPALSSGSLIIN